MLTQNVISSYPFPYDLPYGNENLLDSLINEDASFKNNSGNAVNKKDVIGVEEIQ